ncbi:MAG: hypothetical protein JOZ81_18065 [Chloroflexi bacterium]|nr:hypothetical protein [Chloroflexota bacterium]
MSAPQKVVEAVQTAIVASAHLAAYEHVAAAALACQRLGSVTSGRWRSVGRDLGNLEQELQTAYARAAESVADRASDVGVPEEALWTTGDAAATLDLLRGEALDELEDESPAARVLRGGVLFGASFVEDPDVPDRGTTLLFGWPEPLSPATWPWQANWVVGDSQDNGEGDGDELDLYAAGEIDGHEPLLAEVSDELSCSRSDARTALIDAAMALTRASLLAGNVAEEEEEDQDEESEDGESL